MDEGFKQQASEWFERGDREIETAQLLHDEEGYADAIAYHIEQAVEKYLVKLIRQRVSMQSDEGDSPQPQE